MKITRLFTILTVVMIITMLFGACKPRKPLGIMSEGKMEEILYDYHLAQAAAEASSDDVERLRYLYVQSVFRKHGVTEAEFDSSMVYYCAHPKLLLNIYKSLEPRFESEARSLGVGLSETEVYAKYSQTGDTANVWSSGALVCLRNDGLSNLTIISMTADTSFYAGDEFRLIFRPQFLSPGETTAYAFLSAEYESGKRQSVSQRVGSGYEVSLQLKCDTTLQNAKLSKISVSFFYQKDKNGKFGYFFAQQPVLLRIHQKQEAPVDLKAIEQARRDSILKDSLRREQEEKQNSAERLTPEEFRERKPVERRINVVKEKPIVRRPGQQRPTRQRLRY